MRLFTATAVAAMQAVLLGGTVSAGILPIASPGNSVALNPRDFIQYVPEESLGLPVPNPVIGENIGQHPGAFAIGFPSLGSYFVGVLGGLIDTNAPDSAVYLWETTSPPNTVPSPGPQIQLGFWDGSTFFAYGIAQSASYLGTGVPGTDPSREITSSITPLAAFGITPGFAFSLNAVRIEVVDVFAHNQVTAVAANTVPEPSSLFLLGICVAGMMGSCSLGHRKRE